MHTNVILTNKRRTHTQSNCTNTKLKAWFRRFLRHPARKRSGSILHSWTHTDASAIASWCRKYYTSTGFRHPGTYPDTLCLLLDRAS